jgi:recombinational DNA repair protein (RecF pathway)
MPLTTSNNQFDPKKGGSGKSKHRCWECNQVDKIYTIHPAYGYRVCRACVARLGLRPVPMDVVEDENDGSKA